MDCAARLSEERGATVRIYKNNTDFLGHSYGCHENYLLPRTLPWERLSDGIESFLVTRQIFCGAGKFAIEDEDRFVNSDFQISQRSDFFQIRQSVDTMQKRPLINTRDEPHADPWKWRRFHVILGDANMSPFATKLKVGTMALVLEALVRQPELKLPRIMAPVSALKSISRDQSFQWNLTLEGRMTTTAVEVQRWYLETVRKVCDLSSAESQWIVREWDRVLTDLASDPLRCVDRVDWVAKQNLIREFQKAQGLADDDPWLQSLDLEYHRLEADEGLYFALEAAGQMTEVPDPLAVKTAQMSPPLSTRAYLRGRCIDKFGSQVLAAQWDHVILKGANCDIKISLLDLFAPDDIVRYREAIEVADTPDQLRLLLDISRS